MSIAQPLPDDADPVAVATELARPIIEARQRWLDACAVTAAHPECPDAKAKELDASFAYGRLRLLRIVR